MLTWDNISKLYHYYQLFHFFHLSVNKRFSFIRDLVTRKRKWKSAISSGEKNHRKKNPSVPPSKLNKPKNPRGILSLHPSLIVRSSATPNHRGPRGSNARSIGESVYRPILSRPSQCHRGNENIHQGLLFMRLNIVHVASGASLSTGYEGRPQGIPRGSRGSPPLLPFLLLLLPLLYFILLTRPVSEERVRDIWWAENAHRCVNDKLSECYRYYY